MSMRMRGAAGIQQLTTLFYLPGVRSGIHKAFYRHGQVQRARKPIHPLPSIQKAPTCETQFNAHQVNVGTLGLPSNNQSMPQKLMTFGPNPEPFNSPTPILEDQPKRLYAYNPPEIDRTWAHKEYMTVLSKIMFYLLQDGCTF